MKVKGQNSCFESRDYEFQPEIGWVLIKKTLDSLKLPICSISEEKYLAKTEKDSIQATISLQPTATGCMIIADALTKGHRLFGWGQTATFTNQFFVELEKQIDLYFNNVKTKFCPKCGAKTSSIANFCEHCGKTLS